MEQIIKEKAFNDLNYIPALKFIFDNITINSIFTYIANDTLSLNKNNTNSIKQVIKKDPFIEFENFKNSSEKYDLILIDEDLENRWKWINESFSKTNIILVHDTENCNCDWSLVKKPSDFFWLDLKTYNPWTSIITNEKILISESIRLLNAKLRT
jgi:hypothetical protein